MTWLSARQFVMILMTPPDETLWACAQHYLAVWPYRRDRIGGDHEYSVNLNGREAPSPEEAAQFVEENYYASGFQ